ncbi:hypothetical protein [Achromobacter phage ewik_TL4]|nr:hypothetical protein [Achromobacter phage ewik_TL4]
MLSLVGLILAVLMFVAVFVLNFYTLDKNCPSGVCDNADRLGCY